MTERLRAFNGDADTKVALIEKVRANWNEGKLLALSVLRANADNGVYSIGGVLADGEDRAVFEEKTGFPVDLALTCEVLIGAGTEMSADASGVCVSGSDAVMALGTAWLEATRPGADLSGVLPRYMVALLDSVLAPDFELASHLGSESRSIAETISALWRRELAGEALRPGDWRALRASAVRNSEQVDDPWEISIARTLESLAWPLDGLEAESVVLLQGLITHWLAFVRMPFRTEEDRLGQVNAMLGWQRLATAEGELDEAGLEKLFHDIPEALAALRASGEPAQRERTRDADRQARVATDPIVLRQFGILTSLMRST